VAQHQAGAFAEAERRYRQILAAFPGQAETHGMLGAALMTQGKTAEAISHFQQSLALKPESLGAYEVLGRAYLAAGKPDLAIDIASRALERKETPQGKAFFAQCVGPVRFTVANDRIRRLVLRAHSEGWTRPRQLTGACLSLIKLNGAVSAGIARVNAAWPARLSDTELFGSPGSSVLSHDELLCSLLESDPVTDIGLERLLTNVRHGMLAIGATNGDCDERTLAFYCALARQCFINEYVFSTADDEADRARQLRASLESALATGRGCPAVWPAVVGAYFPLHTLSNAAALLNRSWPQCVSALLVQQVTEPAQERDIAATIPVLTGLDGAMSRAVREQYEESPYPRWVKTGPPGHPAMPGNRAPEQAFDALVAGCGTGLSTVEFARQAPAARIVAVDLSMTSLSYGKRMAQNLGLTNIEFGQADIMRLAAIGRQFDLIDASGVLHHLADPWEGWRILLSLLRAGGTMQVGLYSELARANIVAARALIAKRGYRPTAQDIRHCREDIIASSDPLLQSVTQWEDFFTTNECRDLLFHVQEHRITLPDIKSFLGASGVQFAGFMLPAASLQRFAARFPEPSAMLDLDRWHTFETEAPGTFASMYQFWVRKSAAPRE
jgi:SAM-dependent methyltransferase